MAAFIPKKTSHCGKIAYIFITIYMTYLGSVQVAYVAKLDQEFPAVSGGPAEPLGIFSRR